MSEPPKSVSNYAELQRWVMILGAAPHFTAAAKLTGIILAQHLNMRTGQLNPSKSTLGRETAQSESAIVKHLRQLKVGGFLAWSSARGRHSNSYLLMLPNRIPSDTVTPAVASINRVPLDMPSDPPLVVNRVPPGRSTVDGGVFEPYPTVHPNIKKNIEKNFVGSDPWDQLRRRVGEKAWRTRFAGTSFEPPSTVVFDRRFRFEQARSDYGELFHDLGLTPTLAEAA